MIARDRLRSAARWLGRAVAVVAGIYFIAVLADQWQAIVDDRPRLSVLAATAMLCLPYGTALLLVAWTWRRTVTVLHGRAIAANLAMRSHTDTQIAKYLPGNVFHYVGRHLALRRAGVGDGALARATVLEVGLMIAMATTVASLAAILAQPEAVPTGRLGATVAGFAPLALGLVGAATVALAALAARRRGQRRLAATLIGNGLALSAFFLVLGGCFALLLVLVSGTAPGWALGAACAAWIIGFVVPGSPGGLGTREAVLVLLMQGAVAADQAVLAVALFRAVTLAGDGVCFILGRLLYPLDDSPPPEASGGEGDQARS